MVTMNNRPINSVITDTTRSALPGSVKYTSTAETTVIMVAMRNQARPASGFIGVHQVTGCITAPFTSLEQRYNFFTHLAGKDWTAGMERAARWQPQ